MKNPLLIFKKYPLRNMMKGSDRMFAYSNYSFMSASTQLSNSDVKTADPSISLVTSENQETGQVFVKNDDRYLNVTFVCVNDWLLHETHLAVSCSPEFLPYKTGYIFPGKFPQYRIFNPPVKKDSYTISLRWEPGAIIYLAAHAFVNKPDPDGYISAHKRAWAFDGPAVHKDRMSYFTYIIQN